MVITAGMIFLSQLLSAQTTPDSIVQITAEAQGLSLVSADQVPLFGTFWLVEPSSGIIPVPMPCAPANPLWPVYAITPDGEFLVDGTAGQVPASEAALESQAAAIVNLIAQIQSAVASQQTRMQGRGRGMNGLLPGDSPDDGDDDDSPGGSGGVPIDPSRLWLEITNVFAGSAFVNLHNATNQVYAIWSTTNLSLRFGLWQVETELWPATNQTSVLPFTVPMLGRDKLFLRAEDWTRVDSNGDGVPDWWIWWYFHNLTETATNLDTLGLSLAYDYAHGRDPNVIQFSFQFTNGYVNTLTVPAQLDIFAGVPSYIAVLVNDTNHADAVWQPYVSPGLVVSLGASNGNYTVYIGLKGFPTNATETWQWATVTLYADSPPLTVTNPIGGAVSESPIHLQGYARHPLASLTYDVSNATGIFTNQAGFLTGQFYDTNLLFYTTNYFECSGVVLSGGTNLITLHATDWAGNTTNVAFTLNYSPNTNAPVLSLVWPQAGALISGSTFTLQAQVNNPKVSIVTSVNGNTVQGLVEQNGSVWVQNLPLNAGTNAVTLTASNIFGGMTVTNFNVVENDIGLVIDALTSDQLNQPFVTTTGLIGDPTNDCVFVNGIRADVYEDGSWQANNVPVNPTGTASLHVQVYVGDPVLIGEAMFNQPQPAMVVLASYAGFSNEHYFESDYNQPYLNIKTINWTDDAGGNTTSTGYTPSGEAGHPVNPIHDIESVAADGPGFAFPGFGHALRFGEDYFSVNTSYVTGSGDTAYFQRSSQAQVMIAPTGQQAAGTTNVYLVLFGASEFSNPLQPLGNLPGNWPLPPEWLAYEGKALVNTGITNANGEVLGATLVTALAGTTPDVTPTATSHYAYDAYSFDVQVTNVMKIVDANTGMDLTGQTNTVIVGQQMNLKFQLNTTNFTATNFQWTVPGYAISDYVVAADASSAMVVTNFSTTNSTVIFYWVDGASNRVVQCSATVNGMPVTSQAIFNIYRPSVTFTDSPPSWATNDIIDGTLSLSLGDAGGHGSMNYEVGVSSTYSGKTDFTQLINRSAANGDTSDSTSGQYWMDNTRFYLSQSSVDAAFTVFTNQVRTLSFNDEPSFALAHSLIGGNTTSVVDYFKDYIMFRPKNGIENKNIYVPLGKITWAWSASTTYSGGAWSTPTYSITRPSSPDGGYEFPLWPQTYHNN